VVGIGRGVHPGEAWGSAPGTGAGNDGRGWEPQLGFSEAGKKNEARCNMEMCCCD
jgi:hypothetical protein